MREANAAVRVLGGETLRTIAQELVRTVRANLTIDWTPCEIVRAQLGVLVKEILRRCGYPSDKQEKATETVLEQAALLSAAWETARAGIALPICSSRFRYFWPSGSPEASSIADPGRS